MAEKLGRTLESAALPRLGERYLRRGPAERDETAAVPEKGVGALGHVRELLPPAGRLGVKRGGVVLANT